MSRSRHHRNGAHLLHPGHGKVTGNVRTKLEAVFVQVGWCPRCGLAVDWAGRGRRPLWCSQVCRRAAYEERRAARSRAIAVRVVEREKVTERVRTQLREPTPAECVERVLASPRACREVVNGLTAQTVHGHLDSGPHTATVAAIGRLAHALINSGIHPIR